MKNATFGIPSISKKTPAWVKKTYIILAILLGAINEYLAATNRINPELKAEIVLISARVLIIMSTLAPMFGVKTKPVQ